MQWCRCLAGQTLPIEEREICAVLIFQHILAVLNKDASMHARDAAFFSTMGSQVHIGEDITYGILTANHDVVFAAQVKLLVVCLDDQAC